MLRSFCVHSIAVRQLHGLRWIPDRIKQLPNHILIFFEYDTEGNMNYL